MKVPKMFLMLACASILGATIATGITMAVSAGASGTNTTYYGCVSAKGALSKVGGTPPTCPGRSTQIAWNQVGPPGPTGPQGPAGSPGLLAWAYVNADGTVANSSGNITVANPAAGSYCIGVTGGTAHVAVASLDALENTGGTVQAGVYDASGCPTDASNVYVITRPQSQDGGLPGVNHAFYIIIS
jgi:hypothetical protein